MILGIDAREIQDGVCTGTGRPLANFLKHFSSFTDNDECVIFSSKVIPIPFGPRIKNVIMKEGSTLYWDQVKLPNAVKKNKIDVFYSPYNKIPFNISCKSVNSILDLIYLSFDPYKKQMSLIGKFYYLVIARIFALRSDLILTCSIHSKLDILRIYKIEPNKIKIIPLSVSEIYRPEIDQDKISKMKDKYGIKGRYLLYLGNFKEHKNVESIIRAFNEISNDYPDLNLVLAGPKGYMYEYLKATVEINSLQDRVIFIGVISEKDEPHIIYSAAEAFIMPSFYEGFGLPPLEAMACGTPVIVSNAASIPEVVKDAGIYVGLSDINEIVYAIRRILDDSDLRNDLIKQGFECSKQYNEKNIAKQLFDCFKELEKENR